jgi:hypothetical protein
MKMKDKKVKLCALLLGLGLTAQAQQAMATTGGNASGSGGSISYSVGQIVYKTTSSSIGSAAQGVQQPYEISVLSGLEEAEGINLVLLAYPNPATDYVTLKVENYKLENLTYQLFDNSGKLLLIQKVRSEETPILMETLANGSYLLKVSNNKAELKTLKIIKNK